MDVRARGHRDEKARCPYCHDLLAAEVHSTVCGACGTTHHAACVEELGRCTVLGCAWTPMGSPAPTLTRTVEEYRRAVAGRARRFVQVHAHPPGRGGSYAARGRGREGGGLLGLLRDAGLASDDVHPERGAEVVMWVVLAAFALLALVLAVVAAA